MYHVLIIILFNLFNFSLAFLKLPFKVNRFSPVYFIKKKTNFENQEHKKLSHYEEAQTIINQHHGYGVLSTISTENKSKVYPSTSIVGFTSDINGNPVFCLSSIARHTINVKNNNLVSFTTTEHFFKNVDDYRVSYTGKLKLVNDTQKINEFHEKFMKTHPDSFYTQFAFNDFNFYILESEQISYNNGFGMSNNMNLTRYFETLPDLINIYSNHHIIKLNKDFDFLINIYFQQKYFNIKNVELKRIDKYGMDFRIYFEDNYFYTETIKFPFKEKAPEIFNLKLLELILVEELDYLFNNSCY